MANVRHHAIVCIGHFALEDGGDAPDIIDRCVEHAAYLYRRSAAEPGGARLYLSGVDTQGAGDLLHRHGVPLHDVHLDAAADNTAETAVNSVAPIQESLARAVTLVTRDFHGPRAKCVFQSALTAGGLGGLILDVAPVDSGPRHGAARPDGSFTVRVENEMAFIKNRLVNWLLTEYGLRSRQCDINEALASLVLLKSQKQREPRPADTIHARDPPEDPRKPCSAFIMSPLEACFDGDGFECPLDEVELFSASRPVSLSA